MVINPKTLQGVFPGKTQKVWLIVNFSDLTVFFPLKLSELISFQEFKLKKIISNKRYITLLKI